MSKPRGMQRGFTLVELLVVIAIIGVLVALLLPAIQAAREAARRMSCSNNIHNLVIATHTYHDQNKQLPIGCRAYVAAGGTSGGSFGQSWTVGVFPFIEMGNVNNLWNHNAAFTTNAPLLNPGKPLIVPILRCPSSQLGKTTAGTSSGSGSTATTTPGIMRSSYVAVAGCTNSSDSSSSGGFTVGTTATPFDATGRTASGTFGIVSANGMFHPESVTSMNDLARDGTSATIFLGEQSDFMKTSATASTSIDVSSDNTNGGFAGCSVVGVPGVITSFNSPTCAVTTMRHPINYKISVAGSGTGKDGVNCGINSPHGNGAQVGWGDGRTSFLNDSFDMTMLFRASARDDGNPVVLPDRS